jgi:hypothetical protein
MEIEMEIEVEVVWMDWGVAVHFSSQVLFFLPLHRWGSLLFLAVEIIAFPY